MSKKIEYVPDIKYSKNLNRYISNSVGRELTNLTKSCYYGKFVSYYEDLKKILEIDETDIKEFRKRNISSKYRSFPTFNNKHTLLLLISSMYFSQQGKDELARLFYIFLALKFQSSLMYKFFKKYCNDDFYLLALDQVSHKHLYRVKGGVSSAVSYVAEKEFERANKYFKSKNLTDEELVKYGVNALRNRLAQSIKSFAGIYYKLSEENTGSEMTSEDLPKNKVQIVAEKISQQICTYSNIDKKASDQAIRSSGIRKEIGYTIIKHLSTSEYKEQVKFLIILFGHIFPLNSICKESKRLTLIRRIDSGVKVNKYQVKKEILDLIDSLPRSYQFKSIYESQKILLICHYLTLYLRNRMC